MSTSSMNPKYGKGEVTLSLEDQLDSGIAEFGEELSNLFSSPRYQPPALPAVALKVMEMARRPKVEFDDLAKTIEQDSLLAAKVMTRAQSAMYSGQSPVRSLRQAAVRMGVGGLRDLVVEVAMNLRVFRSPGLEKQMETLRRHSLACAHTARLVCRYAALDGEYAFLCGLLHDVGIASIFVAIGEGALKSRPKNPIALWSAIDGSHESSGATIAKLWKLPDELALVIGAHHHPVQGGYVHPLIAVICVAQDLAARIGAGMDGVMPGAEEQRKTESVGDHTPREALLRARDSLRLTPAQDALMEKDVVKLKETLGAGF
jgi:putative nucleotidyltransferase with HDIG domain